MGPIVLWDQTYKPSPGRTGSQNFEPASDKFDDEAADDFIVPDGETWTIQYVKAYGVYYSGPGPATSVNVSFYSDSSSLLPEAVIGTFPEVVPTDFAGDFTIALPSGGQVLPPGRYWVSVQANMDHVTQGQWAWTNQDNIVKILFGAAWQNPGGGYGTACTPTWGRRADCLPNSGTGPDQVFQLLGTNGPTPTPTPTATPSVTPTPSGTPPFGNGKIAFVSGFANKQIYSMDPDGSNQTNLTRNSTSNSDPAWSPDGRKIVFSNYDDSLGDYQIYVVDANGSNQTNLTNNPATADFAGTWSPDGTKIAFMSLRDGLVQIYVMNADGTEQIRLTHTPSDEGHPAWSSNGKIAFSSTRDGNAEIYVMEANGSNPTRLTNSTAQNSSPAWSPDGAKIAFVSTRDDNRGEIYVMNTDGSNLTRLTNNPAYDLSPAWSPDGTKITFASTRDGFGEEIYVMDADGSNPTRLTTSEADLSSPDWQRITSPAYPLNISTRMRVETGNNVLIGGFIITGNAPKNVAVRGIGPSLSQFGITDALVDPTLELHAANGFLLVRNDDWQDDPAQAAQLNALGLSLQNPRESGIVTMLSPAAYTAILAGKNGGTGIGLVEIYDGNPTADSQLANISTRGFVLTDNNVMIGGFILGGNINTHVVARGIGPSLAKIGVSPVLEDPTLELHNSNGATLLSNDDWQDDPASASQLSSLGLALADVKESGIYTSLPPGAFTAILAGKNGGTGIGLVEIYNVQ